MDVVNGRTTTTSTATPPTHTMDAGWASPGGTKKRQKQSDKPADGCKAADAGVADDGRRRRRRTGTTP